ncbi:MAG: ABC transporter ATP-binding protein [Treponema sp.]|jgi:ABC-type glutathione transport system ATPase component|nr:ABC transporter ATP-binding protein [Treponema sp.]
MTEKLLEVSNLTVKIKKTNIKPVNDISFSINKGDILGIAGESGCGKTLTALSIANLLPETAKIDSLNSGIIFNNKITTGVIFQEVRQALNPLIKAGRQITETLELSGKKNEEQNNKLALEILASLGFEKPEKVYNSYPHELSGGMCQRVMAAIALIKEPELLIADEPSSALDTESQKCILSLLAKMNIENKMTVLIISHDLSIIKEFCSRYLVMSKGKIVKEEFAKEFLVNQTPAQYEKIKNKPEKIPLLNLKNVSNKYILKNINLELYAGEIFGLSGKSGCGKTTLALCILGLIDYEGSVHLSGKKPVRGQLQMIFQEPGASLNPRKKIGWLMNEPLVIHKIGTQEERKRKIDKMLLRVGLDPSFKTRRVHELSGGQKQRICIARALILEPRLLVADEATSSLDVKAQGQILKLLKKINKAIGLTILFISHNKEALEYLCDRTAVMDNGKIKICS